MKIQEVCSRTSLTEQLILECVERKLISPNIETINGEKHYIYTEDNIEQLIVTAALTKWNFSMEHIIALQTQPEQINDILSQQLNVSPQKENQDLAVIKAIERIQQEVISDAKHLVERLSVEVSRTPLHKFAYQYKISQFETESAEEKELAYEKFIAAQKKRDVLHKIIKPIIIVIVSLICLAIVTRILYLISGIPHNIDKELSAVQFRMDDGTIVENTKITIKGKYYTQWFNYKRFEGTFSIHNNEFTKVENSSYISFLQEVDNHLFGFIDISSFLNGTVSSSFNGVIRMSDDFSKISINIFEPLDSDSNTAEETEMKKDLKTTKDLWIVAPANSRAEALSTWNELQNKLP
ncbi:MAG: MerR family transcriptional regulator [Candidatus Pristimantibacillus lignocellulolyticus]|uniref:MerR family transcriptional regulator n=1 Tax=Candidatus Pristimantibacillus lignocellulolyticus TaxID=2994561 RepID=A0A9J6ZEI1_9BACL|nr:MAG: MerR family transcriptional regulator [Candidatus Pristimantibacillus lignocellulolyticus]